MYINIKRSNFNPHRTFTEAIADCEQSVNVLTWQSVVNYTSKNIFIYKAESACCCATCVWWLKLYSTECERFLLSEILKMLIWWHGTWKRSILVSLFCLYKQLSHTREIFDDSTLHFPTLQILFLNYACTKKVSIHSCFTLFPPLESSFSTFLTQKEFFSCAWLELKLDEKPHA